MLLRKHLHDGDQGIRVNTYPHGKIEGCYVYDDIVSTGFTYPVVAAMIAEGNLGMASVIAKRIRARHSGTNRSPWNEPECGLLYSRAMASWNLFDQATGFHYDSRTLTISFDPKIDTACEFSCFVIVNEGWGVFRHRRLSKRAEGGSIGEEISLETLCGVISIRKLCFKSSGTNRILVAIANGEPIGASLECGTVLLDEISDIQCGSRLKLSLAGQIEQPVMVVKDRTNVHVLSHSKQAWRKVLCYVLVAVMVLVVTYVVEAALLK